jgi:DNA-binding transcriptional regulator GbsR (MarR family)
MKIGEVERTKILALSNTNKSIRQIAEEMKISKSTIGSVLKKIKAVDTKHEVKQEVELPTLHIEDDTMISSQKATSFMNSIAPSKPSLSTKDTLKREVLVDRFMPKNEIVYTDSLEIPKPKKGGRKKKADVDDFFKSLGVGKTSGSSEEKAKLISQITMNVNTFEPLLKDVLKPNKDTYLSAIQKKSVEELEIALKTIESVRSVHNITTQLRSFFYMGSTAIEMGSQRFLNMKTQGFTQALSMQDEEIRMILAEYAMDKVDSFKKVNRPEAKLASILAMTLLQVDARNRMNLPQTTPTTAKVPENVAQEYTDL